MASQDFTKQSTDNAKPPAQSTRTIDTSAKKHPLADEAEAAARRALSEEMKNDKEVARGLAVLNRDLASRPLEKHYDFLERTGRPNSWRMAVRYLLLHPEVSHRDCTREMQRTEPIMETELQEKLDQEGLDNVEQLQQSYFGDWSWKAAEVAPRRDHSALGPVDEEEPGACSAKSKPGLITRSKAKASRSSRDDDSSGDSEGPRLKRLRLS